jgi:hypothetical protein
MVQKPQFYNLVLCCAFMGVMGAIISLRRSGVCKKAVVSFVPRMVSNRK